MSGWDVTEAGDRSDAALRLHLQAVLQRFSAGQVAIGPLIAELEAAHLALRHGSEAEAESYWEGLADLETAYAVALDRGLPLPVARDHDIAEALGVLMALVSEQ